MRTKNDDLLNALTEAYKECLRQPISSSKFRAEQQGLYSHLLHAVAKLLGRHSEDVQNYYERLVADEIEITH